MLSSIKTRAILVLSLSTLSLGQLTSLSTNCQAAATSLISNSDFSTCINLLALVNVLSATGSIITPFNTWLSGACSNTCSAATLSNASSTITQGCSTDIASDNSLAVGLTELVSNYTQVREVLCLSATSNNTFCLTNLLNSVQNNTGTALSIDSVTSLLSGTGSGVASLFTSLPASAVCTDCNKALLTKLATLSSSSSSSSSLTSLESSLSSECGASFVDGNSPSDVAVATGAGAGSGGASSTTSRAGAAQTSTKDGAGGRLASVGENGWIKVVGLVGAMAVGGGLLVV